MKLTTTIAMGSRYLVIRPSGKTKVVDGPKRIFTLFGTIALPFEETVVEEGMRGYLVDENGRFHRIEKPGRIFIHPIGGKWLPDKRFNLASHEAMVVIDEDGSSIPLRGETDPIVFVSARQRVREFVWTGSKGDTEEKSPGSLRPKDGILRLCDTQTYLAFPVRTKDNVTITLRLMIYYGYPSLEKLMERDDPLGAMYNKVISTLVEFIGGISFDEFKDRTGERIGNHPLFTNEQGNDGLEYFRGIGIEIQKVVVRAWEPQDRQVQAILAQAATIQTQRTLDQATHEQAMAKIGHEMVEIQGRAKLDDEKKKAAQSEGQRRAEELLALFSSLSGKIGEGTARQILLLHEARQAEQLVISPEMLTAH